MKFRKTIIFGVLSSFIWSSYYPLLYIEGNSSSFLTVGIPFLVGGLIFLFTSWKRGTIKKDIKRSSIPILVLLSILAYGMQESIVISVVHNGSINTSLFIMLGDIIVVPLLVIILTVDNTERNLLLFILSIILLFVGGDIVIANGIYLPPASIDLLYGIAAMIFMSVYFITTQHTMGNNINETTLGMTFIGVFIISIVSIPYYPSWNVITAFQFFILVIIGITSFNIAYWCYFISSSVKGMAVTSILQALIPAFTTVFMVTLGEPVTFYTILGICITSAGAVTASLSTVKKIKRNIFKNN